eukprot:14916477-Alexandrium_andersonii.AAC.1
MSASLVGSEMCIRDRGRSDWGSGRAPLYGLLATPATLVTTGTLGFPPVSYTHLTLPTICSV